MANLALTLREGSDPASPLGISRQSRGYQPCPEGNRRDTAKLKRRMPLQLPPYVLVTPARNEAAFIEKTIESVIAQTVRPVKWVIVSDGSSDGTDEIVRRFAAQHDWIDLVSLPARAERNFA